MILPAQLAARPQAPTNAGIGHSPSTARVTEVAKRSRTG